MIAIKPPQANESVDIARGGDLPVLADGERAHSDAAVAGEGSPDGRRIAWLARSHTRTIPSSPAVTRVLISPNPTPRTSPSWALMGGPKGTGWAAS